MGNLVHGVVNWFIDKMYAAIPAYIKDYFGITCSKGAAKKEEPNKPDEAKPAANDNKATWVDPLQQVADGLNAPPPPPIPPAPTAPIPVISVENKPPDALELFHDQLPNLTRILSNFTNDPKEGPNAQQMLADLSKLTPAMMAETVRLVQADPTHAFLTTPMADTDSFDSLMERLEEATALRGIDEDQQRRGDNSQKTLCEINAAIEDQTQVMCLLLKHANNQRDDAARRTGSNLG